MMDARHRWVFPDPLRMDPALRAVFREQGIGTFAATVMARRGIADAETLGSFLGPAIAGLNDPRTLPDAAALVERVGRARSAGERVMVFGDFDADGLTGLAQLVIALRRLGMDATPYVPSRLEEGHGLSLAAVAAAEAAGMRWAAPWISSKRTTLRPAISPTAASTASTRSGDVSRTRCPFQ